MAGEANGAGLRYEGRRWHLDLPLPRCLGAHQIAMPAPRSPASTAPGLPWVACDYRRRHRHLAWPARLQRLTRGPLVGVLPPPWRTLARRRSQSPRRPGAGRSGLKLGRPSALPGGRDAEYQERRRLPRPSRPARPRAMGRHDPRRRKPAPAAAIAAAANSVGLPAHASPSVTAALNVITADPTPARILICGSLHLAGAVLAENG